MHIKVYKIMSNQVKNIDQKTFEKLRKHEKDIKGFIFNLKKIH